MPDRLTTLKRLPRRALGYSMLILVLIPLLARSALTKITDRFS